MAVARCAGRVAGGRRRTIDAAVGGGGRLPGGAGVTVPGEAADAAVRQEDSVRGTEAQRGEAAPDEGPVRQARSRRCYYRPCRRWWSCKCHGIGMKLCGLRIRRSSFNLDVLSLVAKQAVCVSLSPQRREPRQISVLYILCGDFLFGMTRRSANK
jgi:hypothetical protein